MDFEIISEERYDLNKVNRYLNYELSASVLYFLSFAWGITLIAAIIAASIFAPYMLYIFYRNRNFSFIILFLVVVVIPLITCIVLGLKFGYLAVFVLIPLGFFYFYCFILKLILNDKLKEMAAGEELKRKKTEERSEKELWQKQFNR